MVIYLYIGVRSQSLQSLSQTLTLAMYKLRKLTLKDMVQFIVLYLLPWRGAGMYSFQQFF